MESKKQGERYSGVRVQGQKSQVKLILSEAMMCLQEKGEEPIPKEHVLIVSHITSQTLGVFSQQTTPAPTNSPMETEKIIFEGKVAQELECRPTANASCMELKRECLIKAAQTTRIVNQLDGAVVQSYKPISDHKHNKEFKDKKKAEGKKASDEDKVMDMVFAAFEKHQYYNTKDLVKITNQPVAYLKEILKYVCVYNLKNPNKNMWELKLEYCHYKDEDKD